LCYGCVVSENCEIHGFCEDKFACKDSDSSIKWKL